MASAENSDVWAEQKNAAALMQTALGHYAAHRQVVLRKLTLAAKATKDIQKQQALKKAKTLPAKAKIMLDSLFSSSNIDENPLWSEIIVLFSQKTISEDDLFYIEQLLAKIPQSINEHFSKLTEKDQELVKLKKNLKTDDYHKAKERIANVQNQTNPLTGLGPEDYEESFLVQLKEILFKE